MRYVIISLLCLSSLVLFANQPVPIKVHHVVPDQSKIVNAVEQDNGDIWVAANFFRWVQMDPNDPSDTFHNPTNFFYGYIAHYDASMNYIKSVLIEDEIEHFDLFPNGNLVVLSDINGDANIMGHQFTAQYKNLEQLAMVVFQPEDLQVVATNYYEGVNGCDFQDALMDQHGHLNVLIELYNDQFFINGHSNNFRNNAIHAHFTGAIHHQVNQEGNQESLVRMTGLIWTFDEHESGNFYYRGKVYDDNGSGEAFEINNVAYPNINDEVLMGYNPIDGLFQTLHIGDRNTGFALDMVFFGDSLIVYERGNKDIQTGAQLGYSAEILLGIDIAQNAIYEQLNFQAHFPIGHGFKRLFYYNSNLFLYGEFVDSFSLNQQNVLELDYDGGEMFIGLIHPDLNRMLFENIDNSETYADMHIAIPGKGTIKLFGEADRDVDFDPSADTFGLPSHDKFNSNGFMVEYALEPIKDFPTIDVQLPYIETCDDTLYTAPDYGNYRYVWNSSDTGKSLFVDAPGFYILEILGPQGQVLGSDTLEVDYIRQYAEVITVFDTLADGRIRLECSYQGTYEWSTGDLNHFTIADSTDWYNLEFVSLLGCYYHDSVYVVIEPKTNSIATSTSTSIKVYPNPSSGSIQWEGALVHRVELFDLSGQKVHQSTAEGQSMELSHLKAGTYILQLHHADGLDRHRIVLIE